MLKNNVDKTDIIYSFLNIVSDMRSHGYVNAPLYDNVFQTLGFKNKNQQLVQGDPDELLQNIIENYYDKKKIKFFLNAPKQSVNYLHHHANINNINALQDTTNIFQTTDRSTVGTYISNNTHIIIITLQRSNGTGTIFNTKDIMPNTEITAQDKTFTLIGCNIHTGTGQTAFGHYITYLKINNLWYKYDDNNNPEQNNTLPDIVKSNGYMFVYVKTQ